MELNSDYTGNFVKFNRVFIKVLFSVKVSKKKEKMSKSRIKTICKQVRTE